MNPESTGAELQDDLITVIVPARNEERFIGQCLDSIVAQTETNLQIVVVDGASSDRTPEIVREYSARDPRVELVSNPDAVTPKSLNAALRAARGRWLVRVDAHSTVPADYVKRAVHHLEEGVWGGVGGRKDGMGITPAGRAIAAAMGSRFGVGNSLYHYGTDVQPTDHIPFGAYDTALLRKLGGWDERLITNQDFEMDYRIRKSGHALLFDPQITIEWHSRQSVPDLFRQYRRYGRGKADVARLHPESVRFRHLVAPAMLAVWGAALSTRRGRAVAAAITPYLTALAVASVTTGRKLHEPKARAWLPAAFAAMHVGWGIGFWEGLVQNPRKLPPLRWESIKKGLSAEKG